MTLTTQIAPGIEKGVEPSATRYLAQSRELEIRFNTGARYRWPVESLQMREKTANGWQDIPTPTDEQLANVRLWPHKEVVEFTDIEQCFEIAALMRGQLGSKQWMEKLLSR
ncbi:hypothetical protein [cf. Phormidesmis sp. LEGE 11477]|uniref:hypothetical protein n=1 Tax=cf. Phormidesmis sp. LEGE 11477 TaxID=1828680 RepID=UPI0018808A79|nr:hypothetical protein [cf. Phormidesmis sp. LEGE 11477]MBE9064295.1 hypothetical protein [cf. Phormidesmis sp. LEGE 11477]